MHVRKYANKNAHNKQTNLFYSDTTSTAEGHLCLHTDVKDMAGIIMFNNHCSENFKTAFELKGSEVLNGKI